MLSKIVTSLFLRNKEGKEGPGRGPTLPILGPAGAPTLPILAPAGAMVDGVERRSRSSRMKLVSFQLNRFGRCRFPMGNGF